MSRSSVFSRIFSSVALKNTNSFITLAKNIYLTSDFWPLAVIRPPTSDFWHRTSDLRHRTSACGVV